MRGWQRKGRIREHSNEHKESWRTGKKMRGTRLRGTKGGDGAENYKRKL